MTVKHTLNLHVSYSHRWKSYNVVDYFCWVQNFNIFTKYFSGRTIWNFHLIRETLKFKFGYESKFGNQAARV